MLKRSFKFFSMLTAFTLFILGPYAVNAEQGITENSSFEEIQKVLKDYIFIDENGSQKFNLDEALEDGQSVFVLELGEEFNELSKSYEIYEEGEITTYASMPVWGNWCGPGHGGGIPQGVLDSLCMTHDLCYAVYRNPIVSHLLTEPVSHLTHCVFFRRTPRLYLEWRA